MDQGLGLQRRIALPPDHAPPALRVAILDYASRHELDGYMNELYHLLRRYDLFRVDGCRSGRGV